ncbi:ankyrin repeat domain-containing protein [Cellulomonas sp.]|uniref:ankyrin repeat domain-containing protein n=1 Tax=Cellulomonas sp. TaxID=40001 RepID=UPI001B028670|nr:ankyrin repeat domain-containing protein [Cellulomonas sp.]MBO9555775.1 ankyrin repeat domain-containing protein [Cellulomonas sp.]
MTRDELDEATYCCDDLRYHEAQRCERHTSPWDCPDVVLLRRRNGTFGLPVRDGVGAAATSSISIRCCPWCGSPLPGHELRPPTAADRAAARRALPLVGQRPIVRAAESGDLDEVRALLSAGVPALDPDSGGWTALHAAAERCHPDVVRVLLDSGADVDVRDDDASTPLLSAAGEADGATVSLLIEAGADVNVVDPVLEWTPLSRAANYANLDVLTMLLAAGADPNGGEALLAAAVAGSRECVERLVAAGADPGQQVDGQTAAQLARGQGHEMVARLLESLEHRA